MNSLERLNRTAFTAARARCEWSLGERAESFSLFLSGNPFKAGKQWGGNFSEADDEHAQRYEAISDASLNGWKIGG